MARSIRAETGSLTSNCPGRARSTKQLRKSMSNDCLFAGTQSAWSGVGSGSQGADPPCKARRHPTGGNEPKAATRPHSSGLSTALLR